MTCAKVTCIWYTHVQTGELLHCAGTSLRYRPGIVTGGSGLVHECCTARGIGYFLEPLICVSLFGKKVVLDAAFSGERNCPPCVHAAILRAAPA